MSPLVAQVAVQDANLHGCHARTGATYAVRFRLVGTPGAVMNPGRMQMDWVRYYSLARQGARSVEAPQGEVGTYADAC